MSAIGNLFFNNVTMSGVNENVATNTKDSFEVFLLVLPIMGIIYVIMQVLNWNYNRKVSPNLIKQVKDLPDNMFEDKEKLIKDMEKRL